MRGGGWREESTREDQQGKRGGEEGRSLQLTSSVCGSALLSATQPVIASADNQHSTKTTIISCKLTSSPG